MKHRDNLKYHFSLRKMSIGVCSVVLGAFFVGMNNTQIVKADTTVQAKVEENIKQKDDSNQNITTNKAVQNNKLTNTKVDEGKKDDSVSHKAVNDTKISNVSTTNYSTLNSKENIGSKNYVNEEQQDSSLNGQDNQTLRTNTFKLDNSKRVLLNNLFESKVKKTSQGWEDNNGKLYYRDQNGNYLKNQWAAPTGTIHYFGREGYTISNQWYTMPDNRTYYFDNTGHTVKDRWFTLPSGQTYYFNYEGHTIKNQWYEIPGCWINYYFDNDGHTVKNRWYTVPNDSTYYFDDKGDTVRDRWFTLPSGQTYYFDSYGHTVRNRWYQMLTNNGINYYFDADGHTIRSRWYTVPNDSTYYFDDKGAAVKDRWFTLPGGQTYYFDSNGHTIKNRWYEIPGCWINYYFDNDGHTVKNRWYTVPNDSTYYFDDKGDTVRDRWFTLPSGQTYYFDSYGHTVRNRWYQMLTNNGINYYFDADGHTIRSRWYTVPNDSTYYFDDKGAAVRDRWFTLPGGQTYYFGDDGRIVRNRVYDIDDVSPQYVKVRYYYFDSNGHASLLRNTWLNYDRYHMTYYLDNEGNVVSNRWYTLPDGQTYYFGSNSYPVKNSWYTLSNGQTYYFDSNGHTVKSRYYTLNGVRHWFDKDGKTSFKSIDNISYEGLKLNTKDYMTVSGKAPAGAKIYVKSPLESVKYGEYEVAESNKDGDFQFDPSIWSGQTITILIKDKNGKEIVQRKQLYVPFLTLKNWSYDSKNGILSGSKNGFVGSPGDSINFQAIVGNQTYSLFGSDNSKFDLNIGQYAGHTVTIITFSNLAHTEVAPRKVIKVPPLHFSEIKVNRYGIEGKILGCRDDISVIAEDPVTGKYLGEGNTGSYIFETGRFDISLPESYYGKKVKLIVDNVIGDDLAKGEPFELYIPELKDLPEE